MRSATAAAAEVAAIGQATSWMLTHANRGLASPRLASPRLASGLRLRLMLRLASPQVVAVLAQHATCVKGCVVRVSAPDEA